MLMLKSDYLGFLLILTSLILPICEMRVTTASFLCGVARTKGANACILLSTGHGMDNTLSKCEVFPSLASSLLFSFPPSLSQSFNYFSIKLFSIRIKQSC